MVPTAPANGPSPSPKVHVCVRACWPLVCLVPVINTHSCTCAVQVKRARCDQSPDDASDGVSTLLAPAPFGRVSLCCLSSPDSYLFFFYRSPSPTRSTTRVTATCSADAKRAANSRSAPRQVETPTATTTTALVRAYSASFAIQRGAPTTLHAAITTGNAWTAADSESAPPAAWVAKPFPANTANM
jgi:hypothetical protein